MIYDNTKTDRNTVMEIILVPWYFRRTRYRGTMYHGIFHGTF